MELKINLLEESQRRKPDFDNLIFGKAFSNHMFVMNYNSDKNGMTPGSNRLKNFEISPAAMVFHYSQAVFEGMKAFKYQDSQIALIRPADNFRRLNKSCRRMMVPEFDEKFVLNSLKELLKQIGNGFLIFPEVLYTSGPVIINTDPLIKVTPSTEFKFFIILSPVGTYYKDGLSPTRIMVETEYIRAAKGGTGNIKAAANYGISMIAANKAIEKGYVQSLWLDARDKKYVEEVGSMNIFFVYEGEIYTPPLTGTILEGITRDSIIQLAKKLGYKVHEKEIEIKWVIDNLESGKITDVFGTGTAVVVASVGTVGYKGNDYLVNNGGVGAVAKHLYDEYVAIQYGKKEDIFNWLTII